MKALAMFFIVAGHCWVPNNEYIYVFNVPCFFVISGYLSHKEENNIFWKKLFGNLVVPMLFWLVINLIFYNLQQYENGVWDVSYLYNGPLLSLIGMQGQDFAAGGLKALWFVYTLCLCKIIHQHISQKHIYIVSIILSCVFLAIAVCLKTCGVNVINSFVNVLLAFPFFVMGHYFRKFRLDSLPNLWLVILIALSFFVIYVCGKTNGLVMMYKCDYGHSIFLFLLGGLGGTILLFALSIWLGKILKCLNISVLGGGTMVMLGLHPILLVLINNILRLSGYALYAEAVIVFLMFIPINIFVKKRFPVLNGIYK